MYVLSMCPRVSHTHPEIYQMCERSAPAETEQDNWESELYVYALHRACGYNRTGRPDPQCARHSRRVRYDFLSSLLLILRDFPRLCLFFPLSFSLYLFPFLAKIDTPHYVRASITFKFRQTCFSRIVNAFRIAGGNFLGTSAPT